MNSLAVVRLARPHFLSHHYRLCQGNPVIVRRSLRLCDQRPSSRRWQDPHDFLTQHLPRPPDGRTPFPLFLAHPYLALGNSLLSTALAARSKNMSTWMMLHPLLYGALLPHPAFLLGLCLG
jgi:hypothetical protein